MSQITPSVPGVVSYRLDAAQSKFTAQAFAAGLLSGFGHNPIIGIKEFSGAASFAGETLADASLRLVIDALSLRVEDNCKESDIPEVERTMREQVLEVSRYPEITFESSSVTATRIVPGRYKARIVGELSLHGVKHAAPWILAQVTLDDRELRAVGDFTIKQTDYGIKLVSVAGGMLKVKDEVKVNFEIVAGREGT